MIQHSPVPDVVDALDDLIHDFLSDLPRRQHAVPGQLGMDHISDGSDGRARLTLLTKSVSADRTIPENVHYSARHAEISSGSRETKAGLPHSLPRELMKFRQLDLPSLPPMLNSRGRLDQLPQYCPNCSFLITQNNTGLHISQLEDRLGSTAALRIDSLRARGAKSETECWPRDNELQAQNRGQSQRHVDDLNGRTYTKDGDALYIERSKQKEQINPFSQSPLSLLAALALTP